MFSCIHPVDSDSYGAGIIQWNKARVARQLHELTEGQQQILSDDVCPWKLVRSIWFIFPKTIQFIDNWRGFLLSEEDYTKPFDE